MSPFYLFVRYNAYGLTDVNGNIVERIRYQGYGKAEFLDASFTPAAPFVNQPYTYTGQRLDPETGLQYYHARYFDNNLGRFISRDPIGYVDGMSLYQGFFVLGGLDWNGKDYTLRFTGNPQRNKIIEDSWNSVLDTINNLLDEIVVRLQSIPDSYCYDQYRQNLKYIYNKLTKIMNHMNRENTWIDYETNIFSLDDPPTAYVTPLSPGVITLESERPSTSFFNVKNPSSVLFHELSHMAGHTYDEIPEGRLSYMTANYWYYSEDSHFYNDAYQLTNFFDLGLNYLDSDLRTANRCESKRTEKERTEIYKLPGCGSER